jgi:hypothetical protein
MKKILCFLAITMTLCCDRIKAGDGGIIIAKSHDITIDYKGFYAPVNSKQCNQLIFTIQNNTNDTLYISSDHIDVQVIKNGQIIKKGLFPSKFDLFPPDFLTEWVFTTDLSNPESKLDRGANELRTKLVDSLKNRFAKKLYDRNPDLKKHFTKDLFYAAIRSVCLVIFPKERISYDRLFISASLSNTCIVNSIYNPTKIFTTLKDVNGAQVKLSVF